MTTEPTKRITATIKEITEALGGQGGTYHKLTTPPVGAQKYPNIYKVWDKKLLEGMKTGDTVTITLSQGRARVPDPQADKDYYWEVIGITKITSSPSGHTRELDPLDAELAGKPPTPSKPPPTKLLPIIAPAQNGDKDRQIARAVALKAAVEFIAPVGSGIPEILRAAEEFEKWLNR